MSYLVLTRKEGEKITLRAQPGTDCEALLLQLLLEDHYPRREYQRQPGEDRH